MARFLAVHLRDFLSQLPELLTIHAMPLAMMAGTPPAPRQGGGAPKVDLWLKSWVAPAILITLFTATFQAGVFVGRNRIEVVEAQLASHIGQATHIGAVPRTEINVELRAIQLQLEEIMRRLDRLEGP